MTSGRRGTAQRAGGGDAIRARAAHHPLFLIGTGVVLFSTGPVLVSGSNTSGSILSFWRLWIGVALLGVITVGQIVRAEQRPSVLGWRWAAVSDAAFGIY